MFYNILKYKSILNMQLKLQKSIVLTNKAKFQIMYNQTNIKMYSEH